MPDLDLCYLSATEAVEKFRAKSLSPVELLEAHIARADAVEPVINAFTYTYYDEALEQARAAEASYASSEETRPLEGLPIGIKDESYLAGKPTSNGSLTMKDYVPDTTTIVNERILEAGGIVHARTATPEFSCAVFCHSRLNGVTRNPWNPDFTPGGSSGGTAASLATGTSALCTGSDIAGSIRVPASVCGLVGYKPPYGRNPQEPPFNMDSYCHVGPLARTVSDTILMQNVMAGPHPADAASLWPKLDLASSYEGIKGWKIAYSPDLGFFEVDPEVRRNTESALDVFRSLGATVEEVKLGWGRDCMEAAHGYLEHFFGNSLAPLLKNHAGEMTDYAREFAERGQASTADQFFRAQGAGGRMYSELGPLLEQYNVLVCPTTALPSIPAEFDHSRDTLSINGKGVEPMLGWVMTTPFNMLSRCPVLTMPSGVAGNGVPTGMQIVGRTYRDDDVFQVAMAYEAEVGTWYVDSGRRPAI